MFITPAVAGERVHVGSCSGTFFAIDRAGGEVAWSYDTSQDGSAAQFHGDALITEDLVVVGSDARPTGRLYAFDRASGEARWKLPFPGGVAAELHRHGDTVLAVTVGGEVTALDLATGAALWTFDEAPEARGPLSLDPALGGDRLLVPWRAGSVDAFDAASGEHLWRRDLEATLNTSAVVFGGELVVGSLEGLLYRLSPETGKVLGAMDTGGLLYGDLTIAGDCLLSLWAEGELDESMQPGGPYSLACLEPGLEGVRWRHESEGELSTFRPLVREGEVIVGGPNRLVALDAARGDVLWEHPVEGVPRGLGASGETLYVGTLGGQILALPIEGHRPASSAAASLLSMLVASPQAASPQGAATDTPTVAAGLDRLNATLERIAGLLERQLEGQRLDLMLKRVDVASRQVGSLEGELSRLRSSRTSVEDERFRMQSRLESMAAEVEHGDPEALPMYEAMTREAERGLKHLEVRLAEMDGRILELENELARRRGDLQALQDRLDRELDGLE